MKKLACVLLLAACELQPAPKNQPTATATAASPEPPTAPAATPEDPPPPPVDAGPVDAGRAAPKIEITPACLEVGAKIAQVYIDSAKDPAQRSIYERERANMTRKTGEACTTQAWSDAARACYLATKTPAEVKKCELKFTPPPSASPAVQSPPAGRAKQPPVKGMRPEPVRAPARR